MMQLPTGWMPKKGEVIRVPKHDDRCIVGPHKTEGVITYTSNPYVLSMQGTYACYYHVCYTAMWRDARAVARTILLIGYRVHGGIREKNVWRMIARRAYDETYRMLRDEAHSFARSNKL